MIPIRIKKRISICSIYINHVMNSATSWPWPLILLPIQKTKKPQSNQHQKPTTLLSLKSPLKALEEHLSDLLLTYSQVFTDIEVEIPMHCRKDYCLVIYSPSLFFFLLWNLQLQITWLSTCIKCSSSNWKGISVFLKFTDISSEDLSRTMH